MTINSEKLCRQPTLRIIPIFSLFVNSFFEKNKNFSKNTPDTKIILASGIDFIHYSIEIL